MATTRHATTRWQGSLQDGSGRVSLDSSELGTFDVTWPSRAEAPEGRTSPEELIAAAHSSCFSMALSGALTKAGSAPTSLEVSAEVGFQPGQGITGVRLAVVGEVEGMTEEDFVAAAEDAKDNCPVSQALTGTSISVEASLR